MRNSYNEKRRYFLNYLNKNVAILAGENYRSKLNRKLLGSEKKLTSTVLLLRKISDMNPVERKALKSMFEGEKNFNIEKVIDAPDAQEQILKIESEELNKFLAEHEFLLPHPIFEQHELEEMGWVTTI